MRHIKLFEQFGVVQEKLGPFKPYIQEYMDKTGYKLEVSAVTNRGAEYLIYDGDKHVASFEFMGPEKMNYEDDIIKIEGNQAFDERGEYLLAGTVVVEPAYRRKGIYTEILKAAYEYATDNDVDGIASTNYDIESGDSKRTDAATGVWEKLYKDDDRVTKVTYEYKDELYPEDNETLIDYVMS